MDSNFMRVLQKRDINWCEGGHGYPASCPGPSDPPYYQYCCTFPYLGFYKPSCCMFPIHDGVLVISCLSCIIIFTLLLGLYCWCWPTSLLNRRRTRTAPPPTISQDEMFPRRNSYKSSIPFD
ncbi:uncharacterized protein CELE_F28B4.4 [Caenorhabditis elegans]|uniref:Uncharacterized protein n=1 Tax=Caenorhabditis elegans TaxID=6239 RepID=Q95ZU7_CAEEL|nr:Uncharacterized protein CELE_F28B4.4 [Caenorhabditis elegans]CCD70138.1 Uncharacterized protein CELE_F28B4.4 [Caenorhabditis elegans]|eukprot:NP_508549.1 Uncharacterized protein CELE_F28B4.4 [Caenorhabditis elegans]